VIVPVLPVSWSHGPGWSSFGVWPLFYASNRFGWAVPFLGTFAVSDPETKSSTGAVAFLYWWRRTPAKSFDLAFPLFVSSRSPEHAFTFALPLNFYWRNADDANTLAIPFFYANSHKTGSSFYTWLGYHRREEAEHSGALLWLYWFGGNDKEHSRYDVVFPLVWSFQARKSGTTIVAPLFWRFRGPESTTTVLFPFIHWSSADSSLSALFPVWWRYHDKATGDGFQASPLYFWRRSAKGKQTTLVTWLGGYHRDDEAGTKSWLILPLLSTAQKDPTGSLRVFTPLYVEDTSNVDHSVTRLIGLLFYRRVDPEGSTTTLFPLLWRFHDADTGATATVVLPLFAHRSGPRDTTTVLLPFYWRSFKNGSGKSDGWSAGIVPLLFAGSNAGRRHAVLFPLFWHASDDRASTTLALPLFFWHGDTRGFDSAFLPLLFVGRHDSERYAVQFPLFFHYSSERDHSSTTVTPIGYLHHDADGTSFGVGPVLPLLYFRSGRERSHFALAPLIWHFSNRSTDTTTTVIGPYWHRRHGGETTDALFPLIYYRRGARPGGAEETSFTLFPLLHYRRDSNRRIFATLLGGSFEGPFRSGGFVGPFVWYRDADTTARFVPLLYADVTKRATGERTRQFGPWFQIDAPNHRSRVLFPLFGHYEDEHERGTWVLPTFFRLRRDNGDKVDALLPVFWRSSFGDRKTTVFGLYYDRTRPGVHDNGVVPFYFYARNPERTLAVVPPLLLVYEHDVASNHTWLWAGPLFHSSDAEHRTTVLFPLLWSRRDGTRTTDILFPLFWRFGDTAAKRGWMLIGPYFSSTAGTRHTRGLLPVAWYTRDPDLGESANALLPLFYQSSGKDHSSFLTLVAGYRRAGPSRLWYALPFVFRQRNEATDASTTVIPPLLYVDRSDPESGLTTMLGLYWSYRDISSSTTFGFPLYYDLHEYHLSRTTVFLPFFVRYHRDADQQSWTVAPLFYRHSTPTDSTTVAFPLVWDFKHPDSRTTLVLPFVAHWRRPGYASTWVFPSYYYREGLAADGTPDGTYRRFVLPFYDSGVKRPGDFMWEILGGLVGQERIGHHRYLRLFYMTFETGPAPRAQTAWYSQPLRPSRRAVSRGLNVAGF
jgi:hypothetical protein